MFFQFSFNDHEQNSVYGSTSYNAKQSISFGQLIWTKNLKNNSLLFGLAYRLTYYDDDTTATLELTVMMRLTLMILIT